MCHETERPQTRLGGLSKHFPQSWVPTSAVPGHTDSATDKTPREAARCERTLPTKPILQPAVGWQLLNEKPGCTAHIHVKFGKSPSASTTTSIAPKGYLHNATRNDWTHQCHWRDSVGRSTPKVACKSCTGWQTPQRNKTTVDMISATGRIDGTHPVFTRQCMAWLEEREHNQGESECLAKCVTTRKCTRWPIFRMPQNSAKSIKTNRKVRPETHSLRYNAADERTPPDPNGEINHSRSSVKFAVNHAISTCVGQIGQPAILEEKKKQDTATRQSTAPHDSTKTT